jgi:hypothetical protein
MKVCHWELMAYSLPQFDSTNQACSFGPVSDLPLRFLRRALAPIEHEIPSFRIEIRSINPVDDALVLVPRTDQTPMDNTTIYLSSPSPDLLRALWSYPLHPGVILRPETGYLNVDFPRQHLNDVLLGFQLPLHLRVPRTLEAFESTGESFTTNPAFTSLTISTSSPLSTKMLDGIACNKGLANLFLDCDDWDNHDNALSILRDVFRHALQGNRTLKCLTFTSHDRKDRQKSPKSMQETFERLSKDLNLRSYNRHSVSRFDWDFLDTTRKPRVKSNCWWDAGFSPALVLNCLNQQPGGCPPGHLLDLAVRRINQGALFKYATNMVPCDLSTSSASVIFESVSNSVDYDWLQPGHE